MTLTIDDTTTSPRRPLLSVRELAEQLGTPERFVRRLVCERRIPFHKIGRYVRFDQDDIDDWVATGRVEASR